VGLAILVVVCGLAAGMPMAGEAHRAAAEILGISAGSQLAAAPHLAACVVMVAAGLKGARAVPWAPLVVGLAGAEGFRWLSGAVRASALTVGVGVLATAAMLLAMRFAPRASARPSAARDAAIAAATLSLAGLPGASPIACALVARAWTGRRTPLESAVLAAAPFELRAAWDAWTAATVRASVPELALAGALALGAAWIGLRTVRIRTERSIAFAIPYLSIFGAALLAHAWAGR